MYKLTFNNLNMLDILNQQSITFIRTPESTGLCELDSMYRLAYCLYYASLTNMVSQEIYIHLSTYLDTIPFIGK